MGFAPLEKPVVLAGVMAVSFKDLRPHNLDAAHRIRIEHLDRKKESENLEAKFSMMLSAAHSCMPDAIIVTDNDCKRFCQSSMILGRELGRAIKGSGLHLAPMYISGTGPFISNIAKFKATGDGR